MSHRAPHVGLATALLVLSPEWLAGQSTTGTDPFPGAGRITSAATPGRQIQLGLRLSL